MRPLRSLRTQCRLQPPFAQQPQPAFKSSVEVTSLDVTVVDTNGKPITNLTPADFVVRIDNNAGAW